MTAASGRRDGARAVVPPPERIRLVMGTEGPRIWWWDREPQHLPEGEIHEYVPATDASWTLPMELDRIRAEIARIADDYHSSRPQEDAQALAEMREALMAIEIPKAVPPDGYYVIRNGVSSPLAASPSADALRDLQALYEKATPGPWRLGVSLDAICMAGHDRETATKNGWAKTIAKIPDAAWCPPDEQVANGRLIVAAVNALPDLLTLLTCLTLRAQASESECDRLQDKIDRMSAEFDTQSKVSVGFYKELFETRAKLSAAENAPSASPSAGSISAEDLERAAEAHAGFVPGGILTWINDIERQRALIAMRAAFEAAGLTVAPDGEK